MAFALTAAACPAVQRRTAFLSISAAGTGGGTAPVSDNLVTGDSVAVGPKLRRNAARQDLTGAFGGGAYFVAQGLTLSAGSGLNVAVAPGTAMIDGPVNVESAQSVGLTASLTNAFIWLLQTGVLAYTTTATPPAGAACLLGNATTSGTGVTAVDYSGVLYSGAGMLYRSTGDAGKPTDTPAASLRFLTQTAGGDYLWQGTKYLTLPTT